jgi:hypothetical protein
MQRACCMYNSLASRLDVQPLEPPGRGPRAFANHVFRYVEFRVIVGPRIVIVIWLVADKGSFPTGQMYLKWFRLS